MAHIFEDRVLELTTTVGTGDIALLGAVTAYRAFSAVCSVSDTVPYMIEAIDANGKPTGDYEYGLGTYSATNTLTRTTVRGSSNGGSAVSFAVGTKMISLAICAPASASAKAEWRAIVGAGAGIGANTDITSMLGSASALALIATATASASATIDFASGITSTYDAYLLTITDMAPATNATDLWLRVSEDSGATFKSGAGNYTHTRMAAADGTTPVGGGSTADVKIVLSQALGSTNAFSGSVMFFGPSRTARGKLFNFQANYAPSGGNVIAVVNGAAQYIGTTNAINGIRLVMSSGNIDSGVFALYGLRKV